jgi:hypothetical protein
MNPITAMNESEPGYSITEKVFNRREMDEVCEALLAANVPRTRAGARRVLRVPAVRALANHRALLRLARSFVGGSPIPFRATLFDKSIGSNWLVAWHQDTALPVRSRNDDPSWGPWRIKGGTLHAMAPASALEAVVALRVHLDDSTMANGPLRILPGTHTGGVLKHGDIQQLAAAVTPVACVTSAGGVVTMRPLLLHASSKSSNDRPRRVIHIEYAAMTQFGANIELAIS